MNTETKQKAKQILEAITASKKVLLHCHRSPDPDSVCSALTMKDVLQQMGKEAVVIKGDDNIPEGFMHFPGAREIVMKNYFEIDISEFDLFIMLDTGSVERVSAIKPIVFPETLNTVVIDHHISNKGYGKINLIDSTYVSTTQLVADLIEEWGVSVTHDMAQNMLTGMHTDSGGYRFVGNYSPHLFEVAARLSKIAPDFAKAIFVMENCNQPASLTLEGLVLSNIKTYLDGRLAIAVVSHAQLVEHAIPAEVVSTHASVRLVSVVGWDVGVCLVEVTPGDIKTSFRTRDSEKYDLSVITGKLGGGGHRSAAGARMVGTIDECIQRIVDAVGQSM